MITALFHPAAGGTERQARDLARALQKRGASVMVLTRAMKGLPRTADIDGIAVYRGIRTLPVPFLFGLAYFFSVMHFIVARRRSFDIVHCHILQNYHSPAAVLAKWLLGKKVVIKVAATGPLSDLSFARKPVVRRLFLAAVRRADAVIALCRQSAREIADAGIPAGRIVNIPNGVDTGLFRPAAAAERAAGRLLFIGRLDAMKGIDVLLEAVALLIAQRQGVTCDIVGNGPLKDDLEKKAAALGIGHAVHFAGERLQVGPFFDRAGCFILPSRSEGMPNVILEAMASGLPVIATAVGGIPDIIHHGRNGLLIGPDDAGALAGAVSQLLADPGLGGRLGRQAREDARERYAIDRIADAYLRLYAAISRPPAGHRKHPA